MSSNPNRRHHSRRAEAARRSLAAALILCLSALGAADDPYGRTVREIRIRGNDTVSEARIRSKLLTREGRPLDPGVIDADLRSLKRTDLFAHVGPITYREAEDGDGIVLIIEVREMPILQSVEYRGRSAISRKKLEETTGLKAGARADYIRNQAVTSQILRLYREKGFLMAEVRLLEGDKPEDRRVVFEIFEGPRFRINTVGFEGNTVFSDARLLTKVRSKPRLLGVLGGHYDAQTVEEDSRAIIQAYQDIGYLECQCAPVVRHEENVGDLSLTFNISEGPLYKVRNVRFEGHQRFSASDLREGLILHSGEAFREDYRQRDLMTLLERYSAIGCIDADIQPEPRFTDELGVVDLVYHIEEGDRYTLGQIHIEGNERTKFKVIVRELANAGLLPGEDLDGRRLEDAKKRLENLNYFVTDPQMGEPIRLSIDNRRPASRPYGEVAQPSMDDLIQARFQSPEDAPPRIDPLPPLEPLAPGDGPAEVVPFGSGGALDPEPDTLPPIEVQPPPPPGGPQGFGRRPPRRSDSDSPVGTFPTLPGTNMSDVGPDLSEPYANRSFADIATQVEPGRSFADINVGVQEAPTGRILLGVGATSFGGLSGNLIIHERNFDLFNVPRSFRELVNGQAFRGAGQEFRVELSPGTLINRAVVSFTEPDLFNRRIGLSTSGYAFSRFFPDWDEARGGGRFSIGKQLTPRIYADFATRVEDVRISSFRTPAPAELFAVAGHTFLASVRPSIRFDNRNDAFIPSEGSYLEASFEQGFGDFTFPKFTIEGRQHFTVRERPDRTGQHIISLRGFFGVTGRDTPIYERFFAGDFRSMRGFAFRGVGPHILGTNVGGLMSLLGSAEYQFPITANDMLQAVVFTDTGTVENGFSISDYRVAVGTGLRVNIPALGPLPLAFDIAFPIIKGPEDRERIFTFFIGAFY